jgi:hypothetical protein
MKMNSHGHGHGIFLIVMTRGKTMRFFFFAYVMTEMKDEETMNIEIDIITELCPITATIYTQSVIWDGTLFI